MEAGNKNERGEDTRRKRAQEEDRRTTREEGGTRESDRARAGQGEDVMERGKKEGRERDGERTRGKRVSKRTGMMWRKRGEWEERDQGSSHALCKGNGLKRGG